MGDKATNKQLTLALLFLDLEIDAEGNETYLVRVGEPHFDGTLIGPDLVKRVAVTVGALAHLWAKEGEG